MRIFESANILPENIHKKLKTKKITIGVTGFARSGKTVFITALAHALRTADANYYSPSTDEGDEKAYPDSPLKYFSLYDKERLLKSKICSDIKPNLPHFPYRDMRDCLFTGKAKWPEATEGLSHLFIECEYKSDKAYQKTGVIQIELIDYPGEWLVDLPMLGQTYSEWSEQMLDLAGKGSRSAWSKFFFSGLDEFINTESDVESIGDTLANLWQAYLQTAADAGMTYNQPGRMLRPDALRGSPMLNLFPLPEQLRETELGKILAVRFEQYKKMVIRPFYSDYFSRMDRQVVLVDVLRVMQQGKEHFEEMEHALSDTLKSFKYSKNPLLSWLGGTKTTNLLIAATKADHIVSGDRVHLKKFVEKWLNLEVDADGHLAYNVKKMEVLAMASIRATRDCKTQERPIREVLFGQPSSSAQTDAYDPGELPRDIPPRWDEMDFQFFHFEPCVRDLYSDELHDFPAINLGKALEFLIGGDCK